MEPAQSVMAASVSCNSLSVYPFRAFPNGLLSQDEQERDHHQKGESKDQPLFGKCFH